MVRPLAKPGARNSRTDDHRKRLDQESLPTDCRVETGGTGIAEIAALGNNGR